MRRLLILAALAALTLPVSTALAVPMCGGPDFRERDYGISPLFTGGSGEERLARLYEQKLRARGIDANTTRFWNGCIRTFVREGGVETMRFYDPDTLQEVPLD